MVQTIPQPNIEKPHRRQPWEALRPPGPAPESAPSPEGQAERSGEAIARPGAGPSWVANEDRVMTASGGQAFLSVGEAERRLKAIENIMADGLGDIYVRLAPSQQAEFKRKGEEAAREISGLLAEAKSRLSAIIKLIRGWLKQIPGVSRYYLEQEAKIKADAIIKLRSDRP